MSSPHQQALQLLLLFGRGDLGHAFDAAPPTAALVVSMWFPVAFRWSTLPLRVTRKRLAVARWVFVFGMSDLPFV